NILVGAPKANSSSSSSVTERGAVYSCPWQSGGTCTQIVFDNTDNRVENGQQMEFKSSQWFGATVRSDGEHILACAPLYQWSTYGFKEREPVGTCFLKKGSTVVEYSPCRSVSATPEGQGFCQAGFSADIVKNKRVVVGGPGSFYWQGQLISDDISEVLSRLTKELTTKYSNQMATKSASAQYDDSYLGYSVAVGDFNNDGVDDYVTGVPRGEKALGYVNIFNGQNMASTVNFTGLQMAAYFGNAVAATDINSDGKLDLLVGAPLFMERGSDGKLREVGQVYIYLSSGGFSFQPPFKLTGSEIYSRFGSSITSLGDLDGDGFNDVAVSAPYGGSSRQGLVYIYNGRAGGPDSQPSQVLKGKWASTSLPPSFGYAMHGAMDIDQNGYPDLVVGVFGADKAVLYRARPVISVNSTLDITPQILSLEDKSCTLPGTSTTVSCFMVKYCLKASGKGAPSTLNFQVDLTLDRLKQKGAIKRVLFLHNSLSQYTKFMRVTNGGSQSCEELQAYLIDESEFRDKITPISIFMEFSLDYASAADKSGLQPILDQSNPANVIKQAHILLDCGDDNICKPDLRLDVISDQKQIYIGDDNPLTLEVTAENRGEGAYEAELSIIIPPQADFIGVVRNSKTLSRLSCAYKRENQTRVVCDLGNPMKGGTKIVAGLRFSVHQLSEQDTSVKFDLQILSSNQYNSSSNLVTVVTKLAVLAKVEIRGASAPEQVFLPIANWQPKENPVVEDDIGPLVQHIYELRNKGPSAFSKAMLDVEWPYRYNNGSLLYITKYEVDGAMNCSTDIEINPLNVTNPMYWNKNATFSGGDRPEGRTRSHVHRRDVQEQRAEEGDMLTLDCEKAQCLKIKCQVGRLERGQSAILFIYSRLAVSTFLQADVQNHSYVVKSSASFSVIEMPYKNLPFDLPVNSTSVSLYHICVVWVNSELIQPAPIWVVVVAVLAGLLLLAMLIFIMYKLGFFKRVRPPQEDGTEKEQLQPQENGDKNTE
ncbi:integrin alpha-V precursor, partial [Silurus meridionalis]